jgi:hypothetical protein
VLVAPSFGGRFVLLAAPVAVQQEVTGSLIPRYHERIYVAAGSLGRILQFFPHPRLNLVEPLAQLLGILASLKDTVGLDGGDPTQGGAEDDLGGLR